jgi:hypothetical protein
MIAASVQYMRRTSSGKLGTGLGGLDHLARGVKEDSREGGSGPRVDRVLLAVDGDSRGVRSGGRVDRVVRGAAGDSRTIGKR